jgi:hypothetical protein
MPRTHNAASPPLFDESAGHLDGCVLFAAQDVGRFLVHRRHVRSMNDIHIDPGEVKLRQFSGNNIIAPDEQNLELSGSGRVYGTRDTHGRTEVPAHDVNRYNGRVLRQRACRHMLFRRLGHNLTVTVNATRRTNGMGKRGFTALAEYHGRNSHMMVRAAHAFFGFGFFVLLNSHGFLLAVALLRPCVLAPHF